MQPIESIIPAVSRIPRKLPVQKLELSNKRTRHSRRFIHPDGHFTEEIFLKPQFYKNSKSRKWEEINNNLEQYDNNPHYYVNTANDFIALFAKNTSNSRLFTVSKNQFELTLTPLDTNPVLGTVNENTITYSNIYPNIDLRYIVEESSVKEFLILNTRTKGSFSFQIELKGLKVEQVSGKTVFVDKDGQIQWFFDDPFMVDAT